MKKFIVFAILVAFTFSLTACSDSSAYIANTISGDLTKISNTVKNLKTISDNEIIVSDLLSEKSIASMRKLSPHEKGTGAKSLEDAQEAGGNAYNVPNFGRNTDTYGNGGMIGAYPGGYYGAGYGGMGYYGAGYGGYAGMSGYGGQNPGFTYGNGIVGTNIDTYRENINLTNGKNYYRYGANGYGGMGYYGAGCGGYAGMPGYGGVGANGGYGAYPYIDGATQAQPKKWLTRNIDTYKDITTNINTYAKANYESRYNNTYKNNLEVYYQKMNTLCEIQYDVLSCNDDCNTLKTKILASISYVQSLADQIRSGNIILNDDQKECVKDQLASAMNFSNKLNFAKKEINDELKSVNNLKVNYSANADMLSSKYVRLLNSLDTRCSHLQNIHASLGQIQNVIIGDATTEEQSEISGTEKQPENCDDCTMPPPREISEVPSSPEGTIRQRYWEKRWETDENGETIISEKSEKNDYQIIDGKLVPIIEDEADENSEASHEDGGEKVQDETMEDENGGDKDAKQNPLTEKTSDHIVKDDPHSLGEDEITTLSPIAGERKPGSIRPRRHARRN